MIITADNTAVGATRETKVGENEKFPQLPEWLNLKKSEFLKKKEMIYNESCKFRKIKLTKIKKISREKTF